MLWKMRGDVIADVEGLGFAGGRWTCGTDASRGPSCVVCLQSQIAKTRPDCNGMNSSAISPRSEIDYAELKRREFWQLIE